MKKRKKKEMELRVCAVNSLKIRLSKNAGPNEDEENVNFYLTAMGRQTFCAVCVFSSLLWLISCMFHAFFRWTVCAEAICSTSASVSSAQLCTS